MATWCLFPSCSSLSVYGPPGRSHQVWGLQKSQGSTFKNKPVGHSLNPRRATGGFTKLLSFSLSDLLFDIDFAVSYCVKSIHISSLWICTGFIGRARSLETWTRRPFQCSPGCEWTNKTCYTSSFWRHYLLFWFLLRQTEPTNTWWEESWEWDVSKYEHTSQKHFFYSQL